MPVQRYLIRDKTSGRFNERPGVVTSAGPVSAGEIPALNDQGLLDASLLPASVGGGGMDNPMTAVGDVIVGGASNRLNEATTARGATIDARDSYDSFSPASAIDGTAARWVAAGSVGSGTWLRLDLGVARTITAYQINEDSGGYAHTIALQYSSDNVDWTTLRSLVDNNGDTGIVALGSVIAARYWRVLGVSGSYGWNVYEWKLFSGDPDGRPVRLPVDQDGQVLTVVDGMPAWADPPAGSSGGRGGLDNPMTTEGDLIVGGATSYVNEATLARGATPTASSGAYLTDALDGSSTTQAAVYGFYGGNYPWFQVDLGSEKTIHAFRIRGWYSFYGTQAITWRLHYSQDGDAWVPVDQNRTANGAALDTGVVVLTTAVTARYWRVVTISVNYTDGTWYLSDVELHGGLPAGHPTRLAPQNNGQVLTLVNHRPTWSSPALGAASPAYLLLASQREGSAGSFLIDPATMTPTANATPSTLGNAFDGVVDAAQYNSNVGQAPGHYVAVDMGVTRLVGRVVMQCVAGAYYNSDYPRSWNIEASTTGSWLGEHVVMASGVAYAAGVLETPIPTPAAYRYWRIVLTGSAGNFWRVNEFQWYEIPSLTITGLRYGQVVQLYQDTTLVEENRLLELGTDYVRLATVPEAANRLVVTDADGTTVIYDRPVAYSGGDTWTFVRAAGAGSADVVDITPLISTAYDDEFTGSSLDPKWTVRNQGTATVAVRQGRLIISDTTPGSDNWRSVLQTLPTPPWAFTAKMTPYYQTGGYPHAGVVLARSDETRLLAFTSHYNAYVGYPGVAVMYYWNDTSWYTSRVHHRYWTQPATLYLRIADDGVNLTFSWSSEGGYFMPFLTESRSAWLNGGPALIGLAISPREVAVAAVCHWFRRTA